MPYQEALQATSKLQQANLERIATACLAWKIASSNQDNAMCASTIHTCMRRIRQREGMPQQTVAHACRRVLMRSHAGACDYCHSEPDVVCDDSERRCDAADTYMTTCKLLPALRHGKVPQSTWSKYSCHLYRNGRPAAHPFRQKRTAAHDDGEVSAAAPTSTRQTGSISDNARAKTVFEIGRQ